MRKLFVWGTVLSGVAAVYLMTKRGESLGSAAQKAFKSPFGSLISELKQA